MDITQIIADAKEHLLEQGEHIPTLFAEFTDKHVACLIFADLPEVGLERQKKFFLLGRKIGLEYKKQAVLTLYFISEAWGATYRCGERRERVRIADDPNRRELLTIQVLDVSTGTIMQELYTAQMLRYEGKFLDLAPHIGPTECESHLLFAFLTGVSSAKLSDRELGKLIEKYI